MVLRGAWVSLYPVTGPWGQTNQQYQGKRYSTEGTYRLVRAAFLVHNDVTVAAIESAFTAVRGE